MRSNTVEAVLRLMREVGFSQPACHAASQIMGRKDWATRLPIVLARQDRSKTVRLMAHFGSKTNKELRLVAARSSLTPEQLLEWLAGPNRPEPIRLAAEATLAKRPRLVRSA